MFNLRSFSCNFNGSRPLRSFFSSGFSFCFSKVFENKLSTQVCLQAVPHDPRKQHFRKLVLETCLPAATCGICRRHLDPHVAAGTRACLRALWVVCLLYSALYSAFFHSALLSFCCTLPSTLPFSLCLFSLLLFALHFWLAPLVFDFLQVVYLPP